jgi:hypothetical protein
VKRDLKLGPLPKTETFRASIALSKPLKDALDLYAADYGEIHGPAETADLIPHMLEAFLRSDKSFMKRHADSVRAQAAQTLAPLPSATTVPRPQREISS